MLVLSRKRQQWISIDSGAIQIGVMKIRGRKVRLGIKAPGYGVLRAEIGIAPSAGPSSSGLLVLSRDVNEAISIRGDVFVTVVETKGSCVRLGIEAPATVPIVRAANVA